jgi:hypothetical protein
MDGNARREAATRRGQSSSEDLLVACRVSANGSSSAQCPCRCRVRPDKACATALDLTPTRVAPASWRFQPALMMEAGR